MGIDSFSAALEGQTCSSVEYLQESGAWRFQFHRGASIYVECPWRIISRGRIVLGSCDHNQKFGLPSEVNAVTVATESFDGSLVSRVQIGVQTGDLNLWFENGVVLEVFNHSSGYEGWNGFAGGTQVVAVGGGEIALYEGDQSSPH